MIHPLLHGQFLAGTTYFDPGDDAKKILGYLAWSASAAGVFGLMVVGINMSIQLRRGEPGEGGEHFRGVYFVALASLIATCAGPIVTFLGDLSLQ